MATLVLTAIGNDRAGLVDALSGVIADHGGNWDKSHMARLAGKFAGIVLVTVPESAVDELVRSLEPLRDQGLLHVSAERSRTAPAVEETTRLSMHLVGLDHPGIVHDVSHALAEHNVTIETLETDTSSAPMGGGTLFTAEAVVRVPKSTEVGSILAVLEELAHQLMVDIELHEEPSP